MTRKKTHNQESINVEQAKAAMAETKHHNEHSSKKNKKDFYEQPSISVDLNGNSMMQSWPDVVCKKNVINPEHTCTHQETVYAFCSSECREKFLENPDKFALK